MSWLHPFGIAGCAGRVRLSYEKAPLSLQSGPSRPDANLIPPADAEHRILRLYPVRVLHFAQPWLLPWLFWCSMLRCEYYSACYRSPASLVANRTEEATNDAGSASATTVLGGGVSCGDSSTGSGTRGNGEA